MFYKKYIVFFKGNEGSFYSNIQHKAASTMNEYYSWTELIVGENEN